MSITKIPYTPSNVPGAGALGRHIDRSDSFYARMTTAEKVPAPADATYLRHCAPFDQGNLGSCTGNATAGVLMTDPYYQPTWNFTEATAVQIYSDASQFNPAGQQYPPNDDGSCGNCVAEALEKIGLVASSQHATDLQTALGLLTISPGIFGISWMDSFDSPLPTGECPLTASAQVRGGHEIQSFKVDNENQKVWFYQSWGPTWGGLSNGTFWLSFATLNALFQEQADATFFTLSSPVQTNPNF